MSTDGLLAYCRPGFEPELAAELSERSALAGFPGYANAERNTGFVQFLGIEDGAALASALPWSTLIFARQKLRLLADLPGMDPKDRIAPIMDALGGRGRHGDVWVEHTDSDEGRQLSGLARALGNALRPALRQRGLITEKEDPRLPRLHVLMLAGNHALLGSADPKDASPWPLGVPRLRAHADAPGPRLALINLYLRDRDARAALTAAQEASAVLGQDSRILDALGRDAAQKRRALLQADRQVANDKRAHLSTGSKRSLSPSPSWLKARTVRKRAISGKTRTHQA